MEGEGVRLRMPRGWRGRVVVRAAACVWNQLGGPPFPHFPNSLRPTTQPPPARALRVASVKKCVAVSKLILRNGDTLDSMPMRLQAR
eukprot:365111-Chlamydomonas_euryale.AAC.3